MPRRLDPGRLLSAGVRLGLAGEFQDVAGGAFDLDPLVVVGQMTSMCGGGDGDVPQGLDRPSLLGLMDGLDGRGHALAEAVGEELVGRSASMRWLRASSIACTTGFALPWGTRSGRVSPLRATGRGHPQYGGCTLGVLVRAPDAGSWHSPAVAEVPCSRIPRQASAIDKTIPLGLQAPGWTITSASRKRLPCGRFASDMKDSPSKSGGCS
jgi:hypothetical protein